MNMKKAYIESFLVSGIKTRTNNKNEQNPKTSKIANLWKNFYQNEISTQIQSNQEVAPIYGVYANYESDVNGEFDVLAGVKSPRVFSKFENIMIEQGNFLIFQKNGAMPEAVIQCWQEIWNYFETSSEKRAYKTDFEKYTNQNSVEIYISIK